LRPPAAVLAMALTFAAASSAEAGETKAPPGARVYFVGLVDAATVRSPVTVVFGLAGMGVAPAGVEAPATGHHHLLVDRAAFGQGPEGAAEADQVIPEDASHRHFGKGQTQVTLELPPGRHTLQLLVGDHNHIPHDPPVVSERITITVQ
jgi:hypothetical protein